MQTKEHYDSEMRQRLLDGTDKLNGMDAKLIDIEKTGEATAGIMRSANVDLRNQRDKVIAVNDLNYNIASNLKKAKSTISTISRKEYQQRIILVLAVLLLGVVDIVLLILVIKRK